MSAMNAIVNEYPATDVSRAEAMAYVEDVVRKSGTSFFWAMRRLSADKRRAMYAVYAFCREVDDIVDGAGDLDEKRARLGQWRGEIERLYGDYPRLPISCALAGTVERYGLRKQDFQAIINGMEMDIGTSVRLANMEELILYCDRVACAVGRHSTRVFGVPEVDGDMIAQALGQALQLTKILRDIHEDAEFDRLYLPADLLAAHGIDVADAISVVNNPRLPQVCELIANIAERRFEEARTMISTCDQDQIRPAVMMMEVYHRILHKMTKNGWGHLGARVRLSALEKLWVVLRYGIL
ncbi:MAG: presqualene diphosphate synthase HpnD [Pseudomonadota bacterium]|nr:presqualene diphosphate synthase HpnD [Pseudomonadota bacterium]